MQAQEEIVINCPYCGEGQSILLDMSAGDQEYIEDCQICCQPITVVLVCGVSNPEVIVRSENEM